jgi:Ni/Fe-hydrogenase subunit HybB-like protein
MKKYFKYFFIPQIRPMNWFILFLYFFVSLYIVILKIHFLVKLGKRKEFVARLSPVRIIKVFI